ncbi:MAG: tautomerase family protein [Deltaproteobacteria bacterium]|jgi:4-oxalocrotonate tautomerase|nr:tautomerase family protein [Deltaproteobacteria bacterium]MCW8892608.1 tautomerase family protein [Deltaproteobacteria bacterium]MCW9049563.1 tautomerase family protein [Deltaproteobacteria bacterium]
MPTVTVDGPTIIDIDKKRALVKDITAAATQAYGLPASTIVVVIKENPPENVGVGGVLVADR